jgi:hypothetical protein
VKKFATSHVDRSLHTEDIMLTFDSLPQARVVRAGGQLVAPPPAPPADPTPLARGVRSVLEVMFGMWPLTGVVMLAMALLYLAARFSSP